jgi:hypothetical protein
MIRATTLTMATVMSVAALAVSGQFAAAAPPSEPPDSDPGVLIPPDFVTLIDDTGTITVDVPSTWTDIDTSPFDGIPYIEAMPDREAYIDYDAPGVTYRAWAFTDDTETEVDGGWALSCANQDVQPYDDGVFVGSHFIYSHCGDFGTAEHHVIIANPANGAFTAFLDIQITGPDEQPILQHILDTFNAASGTSPNIPGGATTPPTTTPPPTTVAGGVAAFPPPSGQVPADWTTLVDDTQTLQIAVPSAWTDITLDPWLDWASYGTPRPRITATTDDGLFVPSEDTTNTFSVPGIAYVAFPYETDPATWLESSTLHDECIAQPVQTYDDGVFVGHIQSFDACGGTTTRNVVVVANPADGAFTAGLIIQLTGQPDDAATLNNLLLSFNRVHSNGTAPTTTIATSDPRDSLTQLLNQMGITITDEQALCLDNYYGQLTPDELAAAAEDPSNPGAFNALLDCGVNVFDVPSG